jgi:hypothetical protein
MKDLQNELNKLIENYGIDSVMKELKDNHTDKVFIPNFYYQDDLEELGFEFDEEYNDMCAFDEFMQDRNVATQTNNMLEDDYPSLWEEYIEENS